MSSAAVPGFLPSKSGFNFVNSWPPGTNYPLITLPVIGTVATQDATHGLCGGFVFSALDLFLHNPRLLPPPDTTPPPGGTPMFNYIAARLVDSLVLNGPKDIQWIQTPDHDVVIEILEGPGLARRMVTTEWPAIKADIDSGKPSPLSLVGPPQCGAGDIPGIIDACGHSHQVLAFAYNLDAKNNLTLTVYDCNDPTNDNAEISMNIGDPAHTIVITAPSISAILKVQIRALFRSAYNQKDPTSAISTAPALVLSSYNQAGEPLSPCLFAGTSDGNLWQDFWDQSTGQWSWTENGAPPSTTVVGEPGAVFNSADAGLKFMMLTGNGHILERYWNKATATWGWTDHGTPPGTTVSTPPDCALDSSNTGIKYFMGGANGHLWENYWNQVAGQWLWTDHGTPLGTELNAGSKPGALFNSADSGLKFMMLTANGHIFERYWNNAASTWGWTDHGTPPGTTVATPPGCALDSTDTGIKYFIGGANGHLWENYWDQAAGQWLWTDHGTPPGTQLVAGSQPGALLNSPDAGLKFMMLTANGHIFERYWNSAASTWGWTDHGTPPNTTAATAPSAALDSPATGIKYFVGGADGHLWENFWNQATGQWLWTDHGRPFAGFH